MSGNELTEALVTIQRLNREARAMRARITSLEEECSILRASWRDVCARLRPPLASLSPKDTQ